MRRITKGKEPHALFEYRQIKSGVSFKDMDSHIKDEVRDSLITEQAGLCCYCMQRIPEKLDKHIGVKIEHFECQDKHSKKQLLYNNMFAACVGGEGKPEKEQTCDTRKGNEDIRSFNLLSTDFDQIIRYLHNGTIQSADKLMDLEVNGILGLNNQTLKKRRENVLTGVSNVLKAISKNGKIKINESLLNSLIKKIASPDKTGQLTELYPVQVYYLKKKINQLK